MKFWNDEEYNEAASEVIEAELETTAQGPDEVEAQANETLNWAIQKI